MINRRVTVDIPQHLYEEVFFWSNALGLTVEETARVLIATGCGALAGRGVESLSTTSTAILTGDSA